jgi:hypothetical protein
VSLKRAANAANHPLSTQRLLAPAENWEREPSARHHRERASCGLFVKFRGGLQVLSQKAHSRGRRDRFFDAMMRHAPREVSEVLDIPMAKVHTLEHRVAKKMARELKTERKARAMLSCIKLALSCTG